MSASIQPARLAALKEVLVTRIGNVIKGDKHLENIKRYQIEMRPSTQDCWTEVLNALASTSSNKVLWVCNTVRDAQKILAEARRRRIAKESLLLYHSRFRYKNRVTRQEQVLAAFDKKTTKPCLAITTQVCEMSLDISANLLVTALAPLPSLVQRLGRLNRRAEQDDPWLCLVYPFAGRPYDGEEAQEQMEAAQGMIAEMGGKPYRQSDLARHLESMGVDNGERALARKRRACIRPGSAVDGRPNRCPLGRATRVSP
jgi:CRISPR-associated endonuclease/helicase Cas3